MKLHFTDIAVSRLQQPGTYHDTTTPAFGIRVGKSRKTWFVIRGRERIRTTIGLYPASGLPPHARRRSGNFLLVPVNRDRPTPAGLCPQFLEPCPRLFSEQFGLAFRGLSARAPLFQA
jgi:hypothetical protein